MIEVPCLACKKVLDDRHKKAGISISVMGDEYTYTYYLCDDCNKYTVEAFRDRFLGEDSVSSMGPFDRPTGDDGVRLIKACKTPYDKHCECPSHKALYYGVPRTQRK